MTVTPWRISADAHGASGRAADPPTVEKGHSGLSLVRLTAPKVEQESVMRWCGNCTSLSFYQHSSCTLAQVVATPANAATSALAQVLQKESATPHTHVTPQKSFDLLAEHVIAGDTTGIAEIVRKLRELEVGEQQLQAAHAEMKDLFAPAVVAQGSSSSQLSASRMPHANGGKCRVQLQDRVVLDCVGPDSLWR